MDGCHQECTCESARVCVSGHVVAFWVFVGCCILVLAWEFILICAFVCA